jgi:hypothetical protein
LEDYFYCFQANSQAGLRKMLVIISTSDGQSSIYPIEFQVA